MPEENKWNKFKKIYKNNLLTLNSYFIFLLQFFSSDLTETKHNIKNVHIDMPHSYDFPSPLLQRQKSREGNKRRRTILYSEKRVKRKM